MHTRPGRLPGLLLLLCALGGCLGDAERGNDLDPLSDNFEDVGFVSGTVTRFTPPFEGLPDATVHLVPLETGIRLETRTDSEGHFEVEAPTGQYVLTAEAVGYTFEADTLEVGLGDRVEATLRLDGVPVVTQRVRTEHIDRWFPQDALYRLVVDATVSDPDGLSDIERVALVISDLDFEDTLQVVTGGGPGAYGRTFEEDELPVSLTELAGRPLHVEATDRAGVTGSAQGEQIVRVIQSTPEGVSPSRGEAIDTPTPILVWTPLGLPFAFTFRIELFRVAGGIAVPIPGGRFDGLPSSQSEFQVPSGLLELNGEYIWAVSVVDTFGNLSRSKDNGFDILP